MAPDLLAHLAPVALDGSPAQAFASHRVRAMGIARYFAGTRPLFDVAGEAGESNTVALLAHLHCAAGNGASVAGTRAALRRLERGKRHVGTDRVSVSLASAKGDYDMAVKGLITIVYRYAHLLEADDVDFILRTLIPHDLRGGHPPGVEIVSQAGFATPETENHLLMIESSRYLVNQLHRRDSTDPAFDNRLNGLSDWLLGYLQTIARHDFLEFNSRPYARMSLHALLNLYEFAAELRIRVGAQILLDYTMVKFAISSNRGRRVAPFRRHQDQINHTANGRNWLYAWNAEQTAGFFLAYTGLTSGDGRPAAFPESAVFNGLLAGTSTYRPPPAAYIIALGSVSPALHRFYHGARPRLAGSPDMPDPGLEIYYHSPSFLLSAGGMFLNSGYGWDEVDTFKDAWEETARAQATTLTPTRADTLFHELLRFEAFPDPPEDPFADAPDDADRMKTTSVNTGVHSCLIAGVNLRPAAQRTINEHATSAAPALAGYAGRAQIAWKGSGNDNLNVATVQTAGLYMSVGPDGHEGLDGVEGIQDVVTLEEKSDDTPAIALHDRRLYIAWKGSGNEHLNIGLLAEDRDHGNRLTLRTKVTLGETSPRGPALVSHGGRLYLAWTGVGNHRLNVAKVVVTDQGAATRIAGIDEKRMLSDTSEEAPAITSHRDRLYLAWTGLGEGRLNLAVSDDNGVTFAGKRIFNETSECGPSVTSHANSLFLGWRGSGNENLNVAKVVLTGNTAGGIVISELEDKRVLDQISTKAPALSSDGVRLIVAWKGEGADHLNLRISRDGSFAAGGPWFFCDRSDLGFYLAVYRTPPANPDDLEPAPESLGFVHVVEHDAIDYLTFKEQTLALNGALPAQLEYGAVYGFTSPLGVEYRI